MISAQRVVSALVSSLTSFSLDGAASSSCWLELESYQHMTTWYSLHDYVVKYIFMANKTRKTIFVIYIFALFPSLVRFSTRNKLNFATKFDECSTHVRREGMHGICED